MQPASDPLEPIGRMYNTPRLPPTPQRLGETKLWRWGLSSWALHTYLALSIVFSACLILILDGTKLLPGERESSTDILRHASLTVGDVTTLVSTSLLIIRTLGQSWIMTATWRCAMILLQHDGLSLGQLDNMISYRIPTTYSGRHSIKIALVMLMMFPSTYIAPLASGSIDWRSTHVYQGDSKPVEGGFGRDFAGWFDWHQWRDIQSAVAFGALGRAFQSWDYGSGHPISPEGTYRYIAREEAKPATRVENVPMPFIEVHSITWDDNWPAWAESIVFDQRNIRYSGGAERQTNTLGSGMVFDNNTTLPNSLPNSTTVFEARKKVAMLAGRSQHMFGNSCTAASAYAWDGMENITLKVEKGHYNCYALGTIHFTAGIMYFPIGTYLNNRTVEAKLDSRVDSMTKGRLIGDPWAEYCSKILTDMMSMIPLVNGPGNTNRNLTQATEVLVRQSYLAMRQELGVHIPDPRNLTTQSLTSYLEARVDRIRVLAWLVLNIMVGGAGCIIGLVELGSKGRQEVVSTALAPLMTDVREILVADENGISGMSYLTHEDKKSITKVRLKSIPVPEPQGSRGKILWALLGESQTV